MNEAQVPTDILEWPGKDNPFISPFADGRELAPFYDHNNDGVYNPLDGDLPIPLVENDEYFPYEFCYSIYNDNNDAGIFFTEPVGIEIHQISYVNQCGEGLVDNTIFHRLKVNYKSPIPLMDARISYWEDPDVGCPQGDYVGCLPELNCSFSYNRSGVDSQSCSFAMPGNLNMIRSTIFPNDNLESFIYYLNAGTGNPNPVQTDPQQFLEYYNYMKGLWRDGTPLTSEGTGFNAGNPNVVNYAYPFLPINETDWTMQNVDLQPTDMRKVSTIYAGDLQPGMSFTFDIIDLIHYGFDENLEEVFGDFESNISDIIAEYESFKSGTNECDNIDICQDDCVWPGDYNTDGICDGIDLLQWGYVSNVIKPSGPVRQNDDFEWYPHFADNWDDTHQGVNTKHYDGDGNGISNFGDLFPVEFNAFKVNTLYDGNEAEFEPSNFELNINFPDENYIYDPNGVNPPLAYEVSLTENGGDISTEIRGYCFQINIDENLFANDALSAQGFNAFNLRRSLSNPGIAKIAWVNQKFTNDTHAGNPDFLSSAIVFGENPVTTNEEGSQLFELNISHAVAMLEDGSLVKLNINSDAILIENLGIISSTEELDIPLSNIDIYPNPTSSKLTVSVEKHQYTELILFDMNGKLINHFQYEEKDFVLNLEKLTSGIYFIRVVEENGQSQLKKIYKE